VNCPAGCKGIDLGNGDFSGCRCLGHAGCDCPNHPEELVEQLSCVVCGSDIITVYAVMTYMKCTRCGIMYDEYPKVRVKDTK
jgi:hypothetical protein